MALHHHAPLGDPEDSRSIRIASSRGDQEAVRGDGLYADMWLLQRMHVKARLKEVFQRQDAPETSIYILTPGLKTSTIS